MMPWPVWTAIAWACGTECVTGMNSTSNAPICTVSLSATGAQLDPSQQPGLLDPVAGEPERQCRAEDRQRLLADVPDAVAVAQQEVDAADVVLVPVRGDQSGDLRGVVAQVREVGQHEVDPVHVGIGEHQPAVDEQDRAAIAVALLDHHAVAADLPQSPEEDHPDRFSHQRPRCSGNASRQRCRLARTSGARRSTNSGAGPIGSLA